MPELNGEEGWDTAVETLQTFTLNTSYCRLKARKRKQHTLYLNITLFDELWFCWPHLWLAIVSCNFFFFFLPERSIYFLVLTYSQFCNEKRKNTLYLLVLIRQNKKHNAFIGFTWKTNKHNAFIKTKNTMYLLVFDMKSPQTQCIY